MPTYDFKCRECGKMRENVLLRITHDDADKPCCCGETMQTYITTPPMVLWTDPVIEPFRQPAMPGNPVITSTKQNRELMARHDMVDANDLGPPPTKEQQNETLAEIDKSLKAITPNAQQKEQLAKQGLDTILD